MILMSVAPSKAAESLEASLAFEAPERKVKSRYSNLNLWDMTCCMNSPLATWH